MSRSLIPAFALLALATPTALALVGSPAEFVAVVASPFPGAVSAIEAVVAAGGQITTMHWNDRIVLTRSSEPGFIAHLYAAGAGLVLPLPSGGGCGRPARTSEIPA